MYSLKTQIGRRTNATKPMARAVVTCDWRQEEGTMERGLISIVSIVSIVSIIRTMVRGLIT